MTLLSEPSSAWLRQGQALATAGSAAVRREGSVYLPPSGVPSLAFPPAPALQQTITPALPGAKP